MLNYTLLNLSKTGFFLGGSNSKGVQKNMVPLLFCSRNNFYIIDVLEFLNYTKKLLFLFQKLFLNHSNVLMILESSFLKKKIENKINDFFYFLKTYENLPTKSFSNSQIISLVSSYTFYSYSIKKFSINEKFYHTFLNLYYFYNSNKKNDFSLIGKRKEHFLNFLNIRKLLSEKTKSNFLIKPEIFLKNSSVSFIYEKIDVTFLILFGKLKYVFFFFTNLLNTRVRHISVMQDTFIFNKIKKKKELFYIKFMLLTCMKKNLYLILYNVKLKRLVLISYLYNNIKNKGILHAFSFNKFVKENSVKKIKTLNLFFKKLVIKKYNFSFFIDKKLFLLKKWLSFLLKNKRRNVILNKKIKNLLVYFNFLLKLKSQRVTFDKLISKNMDIKKKNNNNFFLQKFVLGLKNKYLTENLMFWNSKWLNGSLTNFYGLKKNLKKEIDDFKNLKQVPEFVMLYSLSNNEGFLNEISTLSLPFAGISDINMDPFFFKYYVPANNLDKDVLYFYLLLLFESFVRGFIKEVNVIA